MHIRRPESAALCSQCIALLPLLVDISAKSKSGDAHTKWWNETYSKIRSIQGLEPGTCELCQILHKAFSRLPSFNVTDTEIKVSHRSLATYEGQQHCTCEFEACGSRLALAPGLPVVTTDGGEEIHAFTGRPVLQLMNPLLARIWMAKCEKHAACKPDYSSKDFTFPFRLIDVETGRLVEAPRDVRYVALSYVWGGVKQVMLNKTTRKFLEKEGSISSEGLREPTGEYSLVKQTVEAEKRVIPRTIRDAIRLCQFMKERYLWTDSLCIMQDDDFQDGNGAWTNVDKTAQIPKRDIIYGASLLTVIAACGTDSNAGLPGVHASSTRTAQIMGTVGDQLFMSICDDPMDAFWRSRWCERAWTFQEFLLSKRHLIFLPEQTVFHCSTLSWSEDHSLEFVDKPEDTMAVPAWTRSYRLRPLQMPDRSRWSESVFFPAIFINQYYNDWLKNFLKRRLTVPSDILFAFNGALSASRRHLGTFHHGLPIEYFCEGLHWSVGTSSMYSGNDPRQGLTQRREGFPSWSWTGWMWNVANFEEFHINYAGKTTKHWCRVAIWGTRSSTDGDIELWKITSPDVDRWARLDFFPRPAFQVDNDTIESELQNYLETVKMSPIPLNCLVIKTLATSIFVSSQHVIQYNRALQVFSSSNFKAEHSIGSIHLPKMWQDRVKDGLELEIVITGNVFFGPDSKFPDQTDEMDPWINCLIVEEVAEGHVKRVTTFVTRFSQARNLNWRPVVTVLQ